MGVFPRIPRTIRGRCFRKSVAKRNLTSTVSNSIRLGKSRICRETPRTFAACSASCRRIFRVGASWRRLAICQIDNSNAITLASLITRVFRHNRFRHRRDALQPRLHQRSRPCNARLLLFICWKFETGHPSQRITFARFSELDFYLLATQLCNLERATWPQYEVLTVGQEDVPIG